MGIGKEIEAFSAVEEFAYSQRGDETGILTVSANGGSITVEFWDGASWVGDATDLVFSADTVKHLHVGTHLVRITPAGGAVFSFRRGVER